MLIIDIIFGIVIEMKLQHFFNARLFAAAFQYFLQAAHAWLRAEDHLAALSLCLGRLIFWRSLAMKSLTTATDGQPCRASRHNTSSRNSLSLIMR